MINQGTIFEESLIAFKFILVGIFFAFIYYLFVILKRLLILDSFSLKFKIKKSGKKYKKCKNPFDYNITKAKRIKNRVVELIIDLLYFILITPMMAVFLFGYNNGKTRWYLYLSVLIGFFIYRIILGKLSLILIENLTFNILLLFSFSFNYVSAPVKAILRKIKAKKRVKKVKEKVDNSKVVIYSYGKSRR